jgi:hypothetical protein
VSLSIYDDSPALRDQPDRKYCHNCFSHHVPFAEGWETAPRSRLPRRRTSYCVSPQSPCDVHFTSLSGGMREQIFTLSIHAQSVSPPTHEKLAAASASFARLLATATWATSSPATSTQNPTPFGLRIAQGSIQRPMPRRLRIGAPLMAYGRHVSSRHSCSEEHLT